MTRKSDTLVGQPERASPRGPSGARSAPSSTWLVGDDLQPRSAAVTRACSAVSPQSWAHIPALLDRHGLTLQARAVLADHPEIPPGVRAEIDARARAHLSTELRALATLGALAPALGELAGHWAVLKGPVLNEDVYRFPGRRSYSDLDLLVPPSRARLIVEGLERRGARVVTQNWAWTLAEGRHEVTLVAPQGTAIDLHWNVLGVPALAPALGAATSEMLGRTRRLVLGHGTGGDVEVPTLAPANQLIHLAAHAVLSGMGPLRLCLDLDQAWRHRPPSSGDLTTLCHESDTRLLVAVALQRASAACATPLPPSLLRSLAGDAYGWLHLNRWADRVRPPSGAHEAMPLNDLRA